MTTIALSVSLAIHQYRAASRLGEALQEVKSRQRLVDQQASHLAYQHGQALCEQGDVAQGMLWLVRGIKSAAIARDGDLEHAFRRNIAAWWPRLHPLLVRCEHPGPIQTATYSPDGRTMAIGGEDGTVEFREAATGKSVGSPLVHPAKVGSVAYSPDGRTLMTGCDDHIARLWSVETGEEMGPPFHHEKPVLAVAFSLDGRLGLTGCFDNTARIWNLRTGRTITPPLHHGNLISAVAFGPDGRTVLTGSWDKTAQLWDAVTGEPINPPMMHHDWVSSVAYSPDGRTILTGCYDRTARLWDRAAGGRSAGPCDISIVSAPLLSTRSARPCSPGRSTASRDCGTSRTSGRSVRRCATGTRFRPWRLAQTAARFSPRVSTRRRSIRAIGTTTGQSFTHEGFIRSVLFSPDGQTILTASEDQPPGCGRAVSGEPLGHPFAMRHRSKPSLSAPTAAPC